MCDWKKWIWPGILATVLLTALAAWWKAPQVEADLSAKALADLQGTQAWAEVELDGRDLILKGIAPTEADREAAAQMAENAYDVRVVSNQAGLLPEQKPYLFSAAKADGKLVIGGFAPNDTERMAIIDAAKASAGDLEVVDEIQLARGAPGTFADATTYTIGQLGRLDNGKATLSDLGLTVDGVAATTADYDAANTELAGDLPSGITLAENNIRPAPVSPYTWGADYDGIALTLNGHVPSEAAKTEMLEAAKAALPNATITDNLKIASGAAQSYLPATAFAFAQFAEFENGKASMTDAAFSISGKAKSVDGWQTANAAISDNLPEGLTLEAANVEPATVSPYELTMSKSDTGITLDGYVPDSSIRSAIVAQAKASNPGVTITDNMKVAAGVPSGVNWQEAAGAGVSTLARLDNGNVKLVDNTLSADGMAMSSDAFSAAKGLLGGELPGGLTLASDNIEAPVIDPYLWSVTMNQQRVVLNGYAPDAETAKNNVEQARAAFPNLQIVDQQQVAAGAPEGYGDTISASLSAIERLASGEARLNGTELNVEGEAWTGVSANEVRSAFNSVVPSGFSGAQSITVREITPEDFIEPDECQVAINNAMENNTIQFESGKSTIKGASLGLMDKLTYAAGLCPGSRIEVGGHTDSDGSEQANLNLSEQRASAVVSYLTRSGIFLSRLQAKGFGEANPIADNNTAEGKAKNRRIEFRIIK